MTLALLVFTTIFAHVAFNGGKLTLSLAALAAGGSALTVGVIMSLTAALPMALGIHAGRLVDRVGVRMPLIGAVAVMIAADLAPAVFPGPPSLSLAAAGIRS